jgi:hypothetical protein
MRRKEAIVLMLFSTVDLSGDCSGQFAFKQQSPEAIVLDCARQIPYNL